MNDVEHNQPKTRYKWRLLTLPLLTYILARLIVLPFYVVLRGIEALSVFGVAFGAGLLAYSVYGLYTSNGRSVMMWGLLLLSITIPILYFKVQLDSDAISHARANGIAENLYRFFTKKMRMDASDKSVEKIEATKDQA